MNLTCTQTVAATQSIAPAATQRRTSAAGRVHCSPKLLRSSFAGSTACFRANKLTVARQPCLQVSAFQNEWPDPEFIASVEESFPEKGIANVEEARALVSSLGWTYLDVRPALENQDVGKVKDSVNIPIMNSTKKWDSEQQKKVIQKEDNPNFVAQVEKRFPDKEAKLLIGCSNGRTYSMDALEALDEAGYSNLAGLRGGYYAWFGVFDHKLNRRKSGEYQEQYNHDGDSAGIHGSGAGFPKMDAADKWVPPEY